MLVSLRSLRTDATYQHHLARAQAHLDLLANVSKNATYQQVFKQVQLEISYAFRLSVPRARA